MNETASSAPKSPSQPASDNYEDEVRRLVMDCIVARDNFVKSIKMHADLLRKMGNPKLYTELYTKLKGDTDIQDLSNTNNYE